MGKKKFINKKKSATFTLVYRDTATEDDASTPVRQFTRVDGGESYVPGFTDDDPRSRPVYEDSVDAEEEDEEDMSDGEDSRFDDADKSGSEEEESAVRSTRRSNAAAGKRLPVNSRLAENVRRELIELGFPDDGYDYNQHMRNIASTGFGAAFVPSTRAADPLRADIRAYDASKVDVQPVNEIEGPAADEVIELVSSSTRPVRKLSTKDGVLDADIVAALENSDGAQFDSADELDDEFVIFASEGGEGQASGLVHHMAQQKPEKELDHEELYDDEGDDELEDGGCHRERPTRLLDEQFEKAFSTKSWKGTDFASFKTRSTSKKHKLALNEYGDFDNDELDEDDPLARGHADISQFSSILADFLNDKDILAEKYETIAKMPTDLDSTNNTCSDGIGEKKSNTNMVVNRGVDDIVVKKTLELGDYHSEEEVMAFVESDEDKEEWDCETVVSTYSNLDNHPTKISVPGRSKLRPTFKDLDKGKIIRLSGKQHLPVDYLPVRGVEGKQVGKSGGKEAILSMKIAGPRAGETLEDKKARKASIKENRRGARLAKKTMKLCYRDEASRAQHGAATMGPNAFHLP